MKIEIWLLGMIRLFEGWWLCEPFGREDWGGDSFCAREKLTEGIEYRKKGGGACENLLKWVFDGHVLVIEREWDVWKEDAGISWREWTGWMLWTTWT